MAEHYREITYTHFSDDSFVSDTTLVFHGGQAYRRIRSKVRPGFYTNVRCDGDPVAYERKLMHEKRVMADFDDRNRLGAAPKPAATSKSEPCSGCGGDGEYEDKHGNWKTCKLCGGEG